jgi:hypothetical protein
VLLALAGKVPSDLQAIIRKRSTLFAQMQRGPEVLIQR